MKRRSPRQRMASRRNLYRARLAFARFQNKTQLSKGHFAAKKVRAQVMGDKIRSKVKR